MPNERVLVVEDESLIRELMVEALTDAGFEVDNAEDAHAASSLLESDGYNLIVTDLHLPHGVTGWQLAEKVHRETPRMPIVLVTGRPDILDELPASNIYMAALPKPFTLRALVDLVRSMLGR
jgi:DNA-binding response OmpR family regulator